MRWKTTAVLAVLLVGLGTFFYVYEVRQGPAREKAASEKDGTLVEKLDSVFLSPTDYSPIK